MLKSIEFLRGKIRGRVSGDKYDVSGWCRGRWLSVFCTFFKYHSLAGKPAPSPSRGEGIRLLRRYIPRNDAGSVGRSMIEMLGVLAIVAVLSVGGIAGYSKAMGMFKDNKQVQQISMLLYNTIEIQKDMADMVKQNPQGRWSVITVLNDLDRIPAGMSLDENQLHDVYGNTFSSFYGLGSCLKSDGTFGRCSAPECYFGIVLNYSGSAFNKGTESQCRNLVKAIAEFDENINNLQMRNRTDSAAGYEVSNVIWGKKKCNNNRRCFYNLTPVQLDAFCKTCATETCSFVLYLDLV